MPRILIADDEPSIVYLFKEFFKVKGFDVDTAENGFQAINKIKNYKYHLAVLDVKMGEKHGLEVLEEIIDRKLDLPVIICTAYKHLKQDVELLARGRLDYDFVTKPPDLEDFWEKSVSILKKHAIKTEVNSGSGI